MAHIKLLTPGSQDFGEPVMQQVKLSRNGLRGADLNQFVKRASVQFMDKLAGIKWLPGEVPVHLIALGAGEYYSENRNGDFFSEKACRERHDTFKKHAKCFRNHDNKPHSKHYGIVKESAYNEDMHRVELLVALNGTKEAAERNGGYVADEELQKLADGGDYSVSMACWSDPDYPILVKEKGYVRIADVQVGDKVWTHNQQWQKVTELRRRNYTGELFEFGVNGLPFPLELTAEHPMLAKCFTGKMETVQLKAARYFKDTHEFNSAPADWKEAKNINVGDRFFCKPITRYPGFGAIDCTKLAALAGYFTAEGSFGFNNEKACTISYTCHLDDSAVRRIPQILEELYPDITVKIRPHPVSEVACSLDVYSTHLAEFMRKLFGRGCRGKVIPPEIFNASDEVKLSYLGAWLDGDGWSDKKGVHWSTASVNLVLQGRDLLLTLGIPASIYKIDHTKCATSGKTNSGIEYTLNIAHLDAWRLAEYSQKIAHFVAPNNKRSKPAVLRRCLDGSYAMRIKSVTKRYVSDIPVYNFEVEGDESYSAAGLASHNCRVAHDICSGCGNKARSRAEYCGPEHCKYGGCRDNLAKTFDDGHTLYVDNPDPAFFDISKVFRPADRIAYTLGMAKQASDYNSLLKEASEHYGIARSSSYLAEQLNITAPIWLDADGPWTDPKVVRQLKVASALIDHENKIAGSAPSQQDRAFLSVVQPLASDIPDVRHGPTKLAHVITALATSKCMLPLASFLAMLTGEGSTKLAAVTETVASRLPGVFNRLASDPRLEEDLRTNPYIPTGAIPSRVQHWVLKNASAWSLDRSRVLERLQLSILRQPCLQATRKQLTKLATVDNTEKLAKQYALYQLGFLSAHADSPDAAFMQEMAVRANFVN